MPLREWLHRLRGDSLFGYALLVFWLLVGFSVWNLLPGAFVVFGGLLALAGIGLAIAAARRGDLWFSRGDAIVALVVLAFVGLASLFERVGVSLGWAAALTAGAALIWFVARRARRHRC